MTELLDNEAYDTLLDAIDNEDTKIIIELFNKYNLNPLSILLDAPRYGYNDIEIMTYLDYIISYNLTNVIDLFIDNLGLIVDDEIIAHTITLHNLETYKYLCELGYAPQYTTLKKAVHMSCSQIIDSILYNDKDLIEYINEDDIEFLYGDGDDINEETIESIRVLFNYNISNNIFINLITTLRNTIINNNNFYINQDIAIEIIDFLESTGI